jgi:hypothetical protein
MSYKGELTDDIIHDLMDKWQGEATRSLFQQVKKDGIVNEPLIVYKNSVLEGNTRLWVIRELINKAKGDKKEIRKWENVPCRIIEENINEEEINHILCNVHIKKKRDWSPFEQACYLGRMRDEENLTIQQIHKISSFGTNKIKTYIEVYREMQKNNCKPDDWNRYYEAYKDKPVQNLHKSKKYDVIKTIKKKTEEGKMCVAQDSRKIKSIVKSSKASKMFFEGEADIKRAYEVSIVDNPEEGDTLLKRIKELDEDMRSISWERLSEIKKDKSKKEIIKDITHTSIGLCNTLKINIKK